ncbi:MAG TPA: DUF2505 domain-containing protein, partial [Mycobacterium sp.]|nr:DUF2505 domain-containing protein [Mycobacterium sp.]
TGEAVLEPADAGCILRFSGTVQVDIPLVGGRIESFVGAQLAELMTAEEQFTSTWVTQSDPRRSR